MIPKKIFVEKNAGAFGYYNAIQNPPYEEEYIRKDDLLNWAKDMKEANDGVCDTSYYQEFIDKLESM